MHKVNLPTSDSINTITRHLIKYTAGLLLCLKAYSDPVFVNEKNISSASYTLPIPDQTRKDSLYTDFLTQQDAQALKLPNDSAIIILNKLIDQDKNNAMGASFLQSRRYLWLANRYSNIPDYDKATEAFKKGLDILDKIQDKLDPTDLQEHKYKLSLYLAKIYSFQEHIYLYEEGIENVQDAINAAMVLRELHPQKGVYIDKYRDAIFRKAVLSDKA